MNKRLIGVLAFALVVAAAASYLVYYFVGENLASNLTQRESVQLIVAARQLNMGDLITENDLTTDDWTEDIPPGAINDQEQIVNRGVLYTINPGEPIIADRLAPVGAGAGLAAMIPEGKRAVAIPVNNISGVAGFVTPGTHVDMIIMGNPPNAPRNLGTLSKTLLQNIEVLSAGTQIQRDNEGKAVQVPVLNLLVSPEDAEIISLATSQASIRLVLRNPLDTEEAKTRGTALAKLFTDEKSFQPEPLRTPRQSAPASPVSRPFFVEKPKPQPVVVEVIHGANKAEAKFEGQGQEEEAEQAKTEER